MMRRSTKIAICRVFFLLLLIGCGAYVVLFSGVLNRDKYAYLPNVSNENIYNVDTKSIDHTVFSNIFFTFADRQLNGKNISQVKIYDRRDNLINATSAIFCEVHTQDKSIECVSHYIITCKLSSDGNWFYRSFSYDSQYNDDYFPYKTLTEDEIRSFLIGQTLNISQKEITITEDNLLSLEKVETQDDIENYKDVEVIKVNVSSDLLQFNGNLTMSFSYLGSSWNLDSITVGDFVSDYLSNVKPEFTDEDYKKIIMQNPYQISGQDYSVNFTNEGITNIQELSNSTNPDGDVFTQNISFTVPAIASETIINAEIVFDKTADGWNYRKITYNHSFEKINLSGDWSNTYNLFIKNPEIAEFTPKDPKHLTKEEKAEKERIDEANAQRASRIKTTILMDYNIEGQDELGYYIGDATWSEFELDENNEKKITATYKSPFVGEFDPETLKFVLNFDEALVVEGGDAYTTFDFYYDFVTGNLNNNSVAFSRMREVEQLEEPEAASENSPEDIEEEKPKDEKSDNKEKQKKKEE